MRQEATPQKEEEREKTHGETHGAQTDPPEPAAQGVGTDHSTATRDWHFVAHQRWAETPEGRRRLAAYPQVKPRTPQEEAAHTAFAQRIMARYAPPRT